MILLVLVLFVFSHPCELWRCPMQLYCYSMRDKLIATMLCFLYVKQTNIFQCMLFMIFVCSLSCCMHSYYVLLLELHSFMHMFRVLWSQLSMLANGWIFIVRVHVHLKNYSVYHLPTRGRAGVKLGDAWYVGNVSIIFYVPCLLVSTLFCFVYTLRCFLHVFWY